MGKIYTLLKTEEFLLKSALFLLSAAIIVYFHQRIFRSEELKVLVYALSIPGIALTFCLLFKSMNKYDLIIVIYTLILIVWASFTREVSLFKNFMNLNVLTYLSIGLLAGKNKFPSFAAKTIFIFISGSVLYFYFIKGYTPSQEIYLFQMNRNQIPVYVVGTALFSYIIDYIKGRQRPVIWISLLALLISTISMSRTGTTIAFLLFMLVVIYNIRYLFIIYTDNHSSNNNSNRKIIPAAAAILSFLIIISIIGNEVYTSSRYSTEGIKNESTIERFDLWYSFSEQMTLKRAFTGFKFLDEKYKTAHNSYLMFWSYCGIAAFPVFIFLFYLLFKFFRESFYIAGILCLILLYPMAEHVIFIRTHDFLLFTLFFYSSRDR